MSRVKLPRPCAKVGCRLRLLTWTEFNLYMTDILAIKIHTFFVRRYPCPRTIRFARPEHTSQWVDAFSCTNSHSARLPGGTICQVQRHPQLRLFEQVAVGSQKEIHSSAEISSLLMTGSAITSRHRIWRSSIVGRQFDAQDRRIWCLL